MNLKLLPLSKEGFSYISWTLLIFIVATLFSIDFIAILSVIAIFILLYLFRNPERSLPRFEKSSVLAPCDGLVKGIVELENDSNFRYKIEIESSYLDVGVLRVPLTGSIENVSLKNGTRVTNSSKLYDDLNENSTITFKDELGNSLVVVHRLERSIAPIFVDLLEKQHVTQTERYGVMIKGETTLLLPHNFRLNITKGNKLLASETLIGYFS